MNNSSQTSFAKANAAFRSGDVEAAIALYQEALSQVEGPLRDRIQFNLDYALRTLGRNTSNNNKNYVPRVNNTRSLVQKAVRAIAFYLPQFHPIPENDKWWGKGFTEWANVKTATPQFEGHYQPHVPDEFIGHYDLLDSQTQSKQVELAKQYGIEGFCFYLYWFSGTRLLEQPIDKYLEDKQLDLPFCLCWANENWTRRWDGLDSEVLIEQKYSAEDDIAFISNISRYIRDGRYIKVNGKPLILVYRPNLFPDMKATAKRWREWCRNNDIGEIYLTYPQSFECVDPKEYGFDAACEFPPNNSLPTDITSKVKSVVQDFNGIVYDWTVLPDRSDAYVNPGYTLYRGVTPSWDNTARKKNNGVIFKNNTPKLFEKWLTNAFVDTRTRLRDPDQQIVFINAWNEWAEGCHLEPDQRFGYAWLEAIANAHVKALNQSDELIGKKILFVDYALPMYDRFAGSRTNYMYLQVLLKLGLKVVYLPADFQHVEPYSTELKNLGVEVLAGDDYKENWLDWFKQHGKAIDFAFLHKPNPAIQFFEAIRNYTSAAIIYQCHDLHYLRLQRQAELTNDSILLDEASFFQEKESYLFSNSDALLTFSSVEEEIIHKDFMDKNVYTVPLFFYDDIPKAKRDFVKRVDLLYVGGFGHTPNRDAVEWFCKEVLPLVLKRLPNLVLNVVGANPPKEITELNSNNVRILGKVSDSELLNLYQTAKLSVIPLRFGAGVKGKVIEALYHAVPLVSTSIGLEGITRVEQVALPKDDPSNFSDEIINLYENESLWIERSASCAKFVAENFTTYKTAEQFKKILLKAESTAKARLHLSNSSLVDNPLRTIAFHLPQYHPIPENDQWWGKGFTEWRNVCKAKPLFNGHYQPHVPADLGFYDLRLEEARVAQADLARSYGISGFCYYHYWFNGHRLLETPVEEILKSSKPDFPFCLCWANENWTRTWDGQDSSVLIEQIYSEKDDRAHIIDLFRFFQDPRYIRIDGKPLFLVYRTENIPDPARTAEVWRQEARKAGLGELYLVRVESIGHVNPLEIGFDASLEFAPDWNRMGSVARSFKPEDPELDEIIEVPVDVYEKNYTRSYEELMTQMLGKEQPSYPWFRCVTPSWDNSARRSENAVILLGSSPQLYQKWLEKIVTKTITVNQPTERVVFINAWNEWAEGNHLEPCIKYGRSYLEATKLAFENALSSNVSERNKTSSAPSFSAKLIGEEGSEDLARSMHKLIQDNNSPESLIISFEDMYDSGDLTYIKGWAAVNDDICSVGSEVMILMLGDNIPRLIIPAKRKRPEITSHFSNGRNYDFSGFEGMVKRINPEDKIFVLIKRGGDMFWQSFR